MAKKEQLIEELADKYHLSKEVVREAVDSQFAFVKEKMEEADFPSIRLPFFGKFYAKQSRINHLKENEKKRNEREN